MTTPRIVSDLQLWNFLGGVGTGGGVEWGFKENTYDTNKHRSWLMICSSRAHRCVYNILLYAHEHDTDIHICVPEKNI